MSFDKFFDIPQDKVNRMVKNGFISCSVIRSFEIYDAYKKYILEGRNLGKTKDEIFYDIAQEMRVSDSTVKQVVYRLDKIS